jgi:beta-glucosidase
MLAALFRRCHVRQLRCRSRGFVLVVAAVLGVLVALAAPSAAAATARCPWSDAAKPANERAAELVGAMTLDEKIGMLHGAEPVDGGHYGADGHVAGIPRLCVPELVLNGAGAGVGLTQRGTTAFPAPIAQAATWDPALQRNLGAALGAEAQRKGINVFLGGGINIARVPMNGRSRGWTTW